jgi:hypothetical protein
MIDVSGIVTSILTREEMGMYLLLEELARDRQRNLLREAAAARLGAELRRSRRAEAGVSNRLAALRRSAGRRLIVAGARMAGAVVTVGYRESAAGGGTR